MENRVKRLEYEEKKMKNIDIKSNEQAARMIQSR